MILLKILMTKSAIRRATPACLALVMICFANAGEMRTWTPAELADRADIIIVGQPTKIDPSQEKSIIRFNGGKAVQLRHYKARISIVHVIKGVDLEDSITLAFSNQTDNTHAVSRVWLDEDSLFVFYLKRSEDGAYVGALEGEFHDGQAVKRLVIKEPNPKDDADQPATAPESKSEGQEKPKSESEVRPR